MAEPVLILGAGAQAKYVAEILTLRVPDLHLMVVNGQIGALPKWADAYHAQTSEGLDDLKRFADAGFRKTYICSADPEEKATLLGELDHAGLSLAEAAIHPNATIATTAKIGAGSIVNAGSVIQPFVTIGKSVMIHANTGIDHDCTIEDFANIAPGATLAGWVHVKRAAVIFTQAGITPGCTIGEHAIIGAGATVTTDIAPHTTVVGTPAKPIKTDK